MVVIRALVQRDPKEHLHVVMRLIRRMDALRSPAARAAVAWLAGGELYVFGEDAERDEQAAAILRREKARDDDTTETRDSNEGDAESALDARSESASGRVPSTVRAIEEGGPGRARERGEGRGGGGGGGRCRG